MAKKARRKARAGGERGARRAGKAGKAGRAGKKKSFDALLAPVKGATRRDIGHAQLEGGRAGAARVKIPIEDADGCVVEHKAPQIVAIEPGHDGWVVGTEPVVLIEFDFEGDTIRRLGMPDAHQIGRASGRGNVEISGVA